MEDKKLNEQESLELIARMIRKECEGECRRPCFDLGIRYGFNFSVGLCRLDVDTSVL